jgi:SAM-dependent methyltransferase
VASGSARGVKRLNDLALRVWRMDRRRVARILRRFRYRPTDAMWSAEADTPLQVRGYRSYSEYVAHQASKLDLEGDLTQHDESLRHGLRERLSIGPLARVHGSILCLGARGGGEVRAFLDLGAFAVGIDVNPGVRNRYVLFGDFHTLQFPDASVDIVYTNALDHALDLRRVLGEVRRVLRPDGTLIVEAVRGSKEGGVFQEWESTAWPTIADLVRTIESAAFDLVYERPITAPFAGRHLRFRIAGSPGAPA